MCGIFGVANPERVPLEAGAVRAALEELAHRGPDDVGTYEAEGVVLGHTRLSIMDPSPAGHQPMSNEDGSVQVSFNGEIYRFWELRAELEALGHAFRSRSDTEVLVHGYEQWGRGLLERIDGMFAFGLWDARRRALLLARDRLGKKPLFWAERGGALAFCSQLRPLVTIGMARPEIALGALREFLFLDYVVGPKTIFHDVRLLPAGSWLEYRDGRVSTGRHWDLADAPAVDAAEFESDFERSLVRATRDRLVSDVPVGSFLSGGIDSATVAALAQRESGGGLATFTVGFDDPAFDERPKAARVAERLGTQHHDLSCAPDDVPEILSHVTRSADHLLADQSIVPLAKLAREAKRSVKVVLTGDGGDELLAGYVTYRALALAAPYVRFVPRALRGAAARLAARLPAGPGKMTAAMLAARFLRATTGDLAQAHASWRAIWSPERIDALLRRGGSRPRGWESVAERFERRPGWPLVASGVYTDVSTWLVDSILAKVDRASMASGLEARSPLLDSRVATLAFGALVAEPRRQAGKAALRRLGARLLGDELAAAPKEAFQTPFAAWFAGPLRPWVREQLASLEGSLPGVFHSELIERTEREHAEGRRDRSLELWSLVALAEWCRLFPGLTVREEAEGDAGASAGR